MNGIVDPSLLLKPSLMTCDVTYGDVILPHPMIGLVALGRNSGEEGLLRNACTGEFLSSLEKHIYLLQNYKRWCG